MRPPISPAVAVRLQRIYRQTLWPRFGLHKVFVGLRGLKFDARDAELTVEGFGRSGNTFAVTGLRRSQQRPVRIISHFHYPFAVARSVAHGVPVCLVLRDPTESIVSYCQYSEWPPRRFAEDWLDYHRAILRYAGDICIVRFEDFTADFNILIDAMNDRYDMRLRRVTDLQAFNDAVFTDIEQAQARAEGAVDERTVHRPSEWRSARKDSIAATVRRDCADLFEQIEPLYQKLCRHAKH